MKINQIVLNRKNTEFKVLERKEDGYTLLNLETNKKKHIFFIEEMKYSVKIFDYQKVAYKCKNCKHELVYETDTPEEEHELVCYMCGSSEFTKKRKEKSI